MTNLQKIKYINDLIIAEVARVIALRDQLSSNVFALASNEKKLTYFDCTEGGMHCSPCSQVRVPTNRTVMENDMEDER